MSDDSSKELTEKTTKLPWGVFSSIVTVVGVVLLGQILAALTAVSAGIDILNASYLESVSIGLIGVIAPALLLLWHIKSKTGKGLKKSLELLRITTVNWRKYFIVLQYLGIYIVTSLGLIFVVSIILPTIDLNQEQELGFDTPDIALEYIGLFLLLVVFTPISEEILFRGYMFQGLKQKLGWVYGAIITAVIFGIAHWQINVAIDTAVMGFYSALLLHKTGSLTNSILLHSTKNAIAFVLLFIV